MKKRFLTIGLSLVFLVGSVMGCGTNSGTAGQTTETPTEAKKSYEQEYLTKVPIDASVYAANEKQGTVETVSYTTRAYAAEEINKKEYNKLEKQMLVYLPYGYDDSKQYNILYLMHGGGENETYWIGDNPKGSSTRNTVDNMIAAGKAEETIIVTPTFYSTPEGENEDALITYFTQYFWMELRNDIIPVIEAKYSTYAEGDTSDDKLIATREHRAFAGFSMGSMTTFQSAMMHSLDIMAYFGCYSGAKTDVKELETAITETYKEYPIKYWYNGNGTKDVAHDEHEELVATVFKDIPDAITDGKNACWIDFPGGSHAFNCWLPDLYNSLLVFYK